MIDVDETRCVSGHLSKPEPHECNRHGQHYWCAWCRGWYGVQHGYMHEGVWVQGCHSMTRKAPGRLHDCACRFCETVRTSSWGEAEAWREQRQAEMRPHGATG